MKMIYKKFQKYFFIIIVLNLGFILVSNANDQKTQLNELLNELKKSKSNFLSQEIEQKIWKIWSTHHKDNKLTLMLAQGSALVNNQQLKKAVDIFSEVIILDPNWAEAWNKRATVLYMLGEFKKSQDDIDKVLELEKRHFGALAGQGLVNIQLKNYEKAIISYKKAQEIYPSMQSPNIMIKKIENLIKQELI
jgi:tetratricopeptide (TPR) repeat protein